MEDDLDWSPYVRCVTVEKSVVVVLPDVRKSAGHVPVVQRSILFLNKDVGVVSSVTRPVASDPTIVMIKTVHPVVN